MTTASAAPSPHIQPPTNASRVAYLVTKFPLLTETFIYDELLALDELGFDLSFFAFYPTDKPSHAHIQKLQKLISYIPSILSWAHLAAHWHFARTRPAAYWGTLGCIIRETWRTPAVLGKSLYAFAKGVTLARLLEPRPPQHLHAHWATMPTTAALVVSRLLGIPFSFTAHAWDIYREPALLAAKLDAAALAVTCSEYNRQYLRQLCPPAANRIHVIRYGVNLERFTYRQQYPAAQPSRILTVGRLVEKKGLHWLIEACARLRDQGIDFVCTIVGDGPQRADLEQLVQTHHLQDAVKLTGGLPHEKLRDFWRTANVFALPCMVAQDGNRDGIPVVLIEAMAAGIPVVSTSVSGIPELIEDGVTGMLVAPNEADQLSQAIARVLADPQLAVRLAEAGRRRVEQEYDLARNAQVKGRLFAPAADDCARKVV